MKSKTHIFMANLLIEDLRSGVLCLPGIGNFAPHPDVRSAILNHPSAFRAGSVGPDFYPDMVFGQAVIHPESSGKWLDLMFRRLAYSVPADYERNLSFALGFMFHYAGDMFGHAYVNSHAKGWFPPYDQIVRDPEKAKIVARHLLVESYMDQKVPPTANMSLQPPLEFIRDTFYCQEATGLAGDSSMNLPGKFRAFRESVHNALNSTTMGQLPLVTDYVQRWENDVDRGISTWLDAWARTAQTFCSDEPQKIEAATAYLKIWFIQNFTSMVGLPDFVSRVITFLDQLDLFKPLEQDLKNLFKDFMIAVAKAITGEAYTTLEDSARAIQRIFSDPKTYLDNGRLFDVLNMSATLDAEFGNYGVIHDTVRQSFHAVYQCLNMGKLHLLRVEDLNRIVGEARYAGYSTVEAAKIRSVTVKTNGRWLSSPGTDNNVHIGIRYNGVTYEDLCDKPGYNDFECDDLDTYDFVIPENVNLSKVDAITARMSGNTLAGDWKCDWIKINDHTGEVLLQTTEGFWLSTGNTKHIPISRVMQVPVRSVPVDPKIMSFLHSLDGKGTDDSNPAREKPWEIGFHLYTDPRLRNSVFRPLFEVEATDTSMRYVPNSNGKVAFGVEYRIQSVGHGTVLDDWGGKTGQDSAALQPDDSPFSPQRTWVLVPNAGGFRIRNVGHSTVLDDWGGKTGENSAALQPDDLPEHLNRTWVLVPNSKGFRIKSVGHSTVLDDWGGKTGENSAALQHDDSSESLNRTWRFVESRLSPSGRDMKAVQGPSPSRFDIR